MSRNKRHSKNSITEMGGDESSKGRKSQKSEENTMSSIEFPGTTTIDVSNSDNSPINMKIKVSKTSTNFSMIHITSKIKRFS